MRLFKIAMMILVVGCAALLPATAQTQSGIPPVPPSASGTQSPQAPVHCTVADANNNMVSLWMTRSDCDKWIKQAQDAAASQKTTGISGNGTPIESDAILFDNSADSFKLIDGLVSMVKSNDFRCDSVSAARPMLTSHGFVLTCNKFSYTYDIQDKGGHWIVTVE